MNRNESSGTQYLLPDVLGSTIALAEFTGTEQIPPNRLERERGPAHQAQIRLTNESQSLRTMEIVCC
jgi:hypothetical protein